MIKKLNWGNEMTKIGMKCILGFIWTSALAAGVLTMIVFAFIDPIQVADLLSYTVDHNSFRIKAYAGVFTFFWFVFNTSTYLMCYFNRLKQNLEDQERRHKEISEQQKED